MNEPRTVIDVAIVASSAQTAMKAAERARPTVAGAFVFYAKAHEGRLRIAARDLFTGEGLVSDRARAQLVDFYKGDT